MPTTLKSIILQDLFKFETKGELEMNLKYKAIRYIYIFFYTNSIFLGFYSLYMQNYNIWACTYFEWAHANITKHAPKACKYIVHFFREIDFTKKLWRMSFLNAFKYFFFQSAGYLDQSTGAGFGRSQTCSQNKNSNFLKIKF